MPSATTVTIGPYAFNGTDALRTLGNLGGLWATMVEGRTSADAHALGVALAERIELVVGAEPAADLDARLRSLGNRAAAQLKGSDALGDLVADMWTTLRSASDALRLDGQFPATSVGSVVQLSTSGGGVPKLPVPAVDVGFRGVIGDVQRVRVHHGRPWQALCLYSDEVLDELRAEGHPIERGSVGENVTVRGIPWDQVRPGVLLRIGTVLAHVQAFAEPCNSNTAFFLNGDFQRMNIDRGPVSRLYATVLRPGHVETGDQVVLEPDVGGATIDSLVHATQDR
ncbi:MAG: hypothetical protein JWM34_3082 [Ilumatobacteraceae bacterium]|nr:hypothetical protein [Ilumatobacteraceae bacterium]